MDYLKGTNFISITEETAIFPIEEEQRTLFSLEIGKNKPQEICPPHKTKESQYSSRHIKSVYI